MCVDGDTLYVADTENHALRAVDLKEKTVSTVAGNGHSGSRYPPPGRLWTGQDHAAFQPVGRDPRSATRKLCIWRWRALTRSGSSTPAPKH